MPLPNARPIALVMTPCAPTNFIKGFNDLVTYSPITPRRLFCYAGAFALAALILLTPTGASASTGRQPQHTLQPVDYYTPDTPQVTRREGEFKAADGAALGFVHYQAPSGAANGEALVYLHGIESHVGWFEGPASLLAAQGYAVYCLDRRGSGQNRENRRLTSGYMTSYRQLFSDLDHFLRTIEGRYDKVTLIGSSWGGKLALAYHLAHPDDKRLGGLIMVTPGLRAKVDLSLLAKAGVFSSLLVRPQNHFDVPIATEMFTTNQKHLALIRRDPLRLHSVSARFYWESLRLDKFIDKHMHKSRLPMLLVLAGQDRVIDNEGVIEVLRKGRQHRLEILRYEDQTHAVQLDAPERLSGDMARWLRAEQASGPKVAALGR